MCVPDGFVFHADWNAVHKQRALAGLSAAGDLPGLLAAPECVLIMRCPGRSGQQERLNSMNGSSRAPDIKLKGFRFGGLRLTTAGAAGTRGLERLVPLIPSRK